jgi:hypothetical protein
MALTALAAALIIAAVPNDGDTVIFENEAVAGRGVSDHSNALAVELTFNT